MNSDVVLLLTREAELEKESAAAAAASGARLAVARTAGEALQIVCERNGELDLVVIDFDNGARGMILLSALGMLREHLPIVALVSTDRDHSAKLAYADGAACCLTKPINAAELGMVICALGKSKLHSKQFSGKGRWKNAA